MAQGAHDQERCLLFVYGSLKRGQANHGQLGAGQYVSTTRTAPRFALRVISGYPALVPGARAILGELHRIAVSTLPSLDEFEGSAYFREEIELEGGARALAYLARDLEVGAPYPADEWSAADV